jgi:hypothetical protein
MFLVGDTLFDDINGLISIVSALIEGEWAFSSAV